MNDHCTTTNYLVYIQPTTTAGEMDFGYHDVRYGGHHAGVERANEDIRRQDRENKAREQQALEQMRAIGGIPSAVILPPNATGINNTRHDET